MFKKKFFYYFTVWLITILITIIWTFENPEKIDKVKNTLKYDFSIGNILSQLKSKVIQKKYQSVQKKRSIEIDSAYNLLNLDYFTIPVYSSYGGISQIGKNILYVSGDGDLYLLKEDDLNKEKYKFDKINAKKIKNNKKIFVEKNEPIVGKNAEKYFGIKDIIINKFANFDNKLLLASSLDYNKNKDCYILSVFLSEILNEKKLEISDWRKIFSTKKCLSVNLTKNPKFAGASAGGRLFKFDEESILISIGDFYADGVNGPMQSQNLSNLYGKILKVNINDLTSEIYSFGHRNPQGLYIDKNKNIFSTEHGPTGGDELNLVVQNNNYGWPYATYGTNYKSYDAYDKAADNLIKEWPIDKTNNTHDGYTKPLFSWGNQLGISNLIVYENDYFAKWNNNLIISSLATKQLVRMIYDYENQSILYKENIKVGKRIRDLILLNNGKIALLTDRGKKLNEYPEIIIVSKKN